jgi:phytoene dehydrogenase-like protein
MAGRYDAVVVGSGPNGLGAAITLAQAGRSVLVLEGAQEPGGGMRSAELTLPGFVHDVCSAIHPLVAASPLFRALPLAEHGLELVWPEVQAAHPLPGGRAAALVRSVEDTARALGADRRAYERLMGWLVSAMPGLGDDILGPLRLPRHPLSFTRFGLTGLRSAAAVATARFATDEARALLAGMAAHSMLKLTQPVSAAFGLFLQGLAHAVGWPAARGGSGTIARALVSCLRSLGGEIQTGRKVANFGELPPARAYLFDLTPRQLIEICGARLNARYRRALERYRYGPGIFKVDYALTGPVPWDAEACRKAGTVHVCGTFEEVVASEEAVNRGVHPERPYVLTAQQSVFDPTRAPEGKHTLWAYCHVPSGSDLDMTERIEAQIERFAPGFRDLILERSTMDARAFESYNPNYVGGDINGGIQDLWQTFTRPARRLNPYATPDPSIYICSSSTPPGGGVHGMCGYFAARAVLRRVLR